MLQTDWQQQTEKQMMEVDLTIYDAEYYLLCSIGVEDNLIIKTQKQQKSLF